MAITKIIHKKTDVPQKRPGIADIDLGEIAINTHDGKMFIKQDRNGVVDIVQVGDDPTPKVFYVSKGGKPGNLGTSLGDAFQTIDSAVSVITDIQEFEFDEATCERDLNLILDGLQYDIAFGTNYNAVTSGLSYQRAGANKVLDEQISATRGAFNEAKGAIFSIPEVKLSTGYDGAVERNNRHWSEVIDIFVNGTQSTENFADSVEYPVPVVLPTTDADDAAVILQNNREYLKAELVQYIAENFPALTYDRTLCSRDTGFIIDAVTLDLMLGTNVNSVVAGSSYYRATVSTQKVIGQQLDGTVGAINELGRLIGELSIDSNSRVSINSSIAEINDILANGLENRDTLTFPAAPASSSNQQAAATAIQSNKTAIIASTIAFLDSVYPDLTYDTTKCERDVDYILDGLTHDVLYGGNYQSRRSADAYYSNAVNQLGSDSERLPTIAAYDELKNIVNTYVTTSTEQARVDDLIEIINEVLEANNDNVLRDLVYPDFTGISGTTTASYNLILADSADLKAGVIAWSDQNGPATYDRVRCKRDVGFIVDGLTFDVLYGGNFATDIVKRAYYSFGTNQLGDSAGDPEVVATATTYQHLKQIVDELLSNSLSTNLYSGGTYPGAFPGPDTTGNGGQYSTATEAQVTNDLLDNLITIIQDGDLDALDSVQEPSLAARGVSAELRTAIKAINDERPLIIEQSVQRGNATNDIVVYLKSGDYVINNPIQLPEKVAIVGDNLRTTTIRPRSVDSDLFYVKSGCFLKDITFKDHQSGAACVAFNPNVDSARAGPFIIQSPYVQNCTSITTDGVGMKIDGSKAWGLRSMVSDAFTQYNAAGIGTYLLNRGYAQLVSIFTISTGTSILAETGGQCSITNSNSSFGDRGLVASGSSPILYDGILDSDHLKFDDVIQVNEITNLDSSDWLNVYGAYRKPNYGDAMKFDSENYYYTVLGVDSVAPGIYNLTFEPPLNQDMIRNQRVTFRQRSVITSSSHTFEYVGSGTNTFTAIPQNGGIPDATKEVIFDSETNEGLVVFTSTDQLGDFRIGSELTIRRQAGRIEGETFERSLYAILTPYILALEG